jgi:hypothetical protein
MDTKAFSSPSRLSSVPRVTLSGVNRVMSTSSYVPENQQRVVTTDPELMWSKIENIIDEPVVEKLYNALDNDIATGTDISDPKLYTTAKINNIEIVVNLVSMVAAIGVGATGIGIPFIPMIFAISAGIKSMLNTTITAEDILLISNIIHQYVMLTSYPSIVKIMEYKSCIETGGIQCTKVITFEGTGELDDIGHPIFKFINELFDEYINQMMKMVSNKNKKKKDNKTSIIDTHSICSGIFTTLNEYLHMQGERATMAYFKAHPIFKANTSNIKDAEQKAIQVEKSITASFKKTLLSLSTSVQKKISATMVNIIDDSSSYVKTVASVVSSAGTKRKKKRARRQSRKH